MPKLRELYDQPAALEPLFPTDKAEDLRELAAELLRKSARLGQSFPVWLVKAVVEDDDAEGAGLELCEDVPAQADGVTDAWTNASSRCCQCRGVSGSRSASCRAVPSS